MNISAPLLEEPFEAKDQVHTVPFDHFLDGPPIPGVPFQWVPTLPTLLIRMLLEVKGRDVIVRDVAPLVQPRRYDLPSVPDDMNDERLGKGLPDQRNASEEMVVRLDVKRLWVLAMAMEPGDPEILDIEPACSLGEQTLPPSTEGGAGLMKAPSLRHFFVEEARKEIGPRPTRR
jgi:hypothetical protein